MKLRYLLSFSEKFLFFITEPSPERVDGFPGVFQDSISVGEQRWR